MAYLYAYRTMGLTLEALAIRGSTPTVKQPYRERWRTIQLSDGLRVLKLAARNVTTSKDGALLVKQFEREFCQLVQTRYGLTMNSGTAALHSAYFAVGVTKNTEVILPSYTWFATAAPVLQLGGTPVFCDIDPDTLTIAPDGVEALITARTRAICAVHVWGNPAAMDRLAAIAKKYDIALIEDASHAHGASYGGRPVGSWGDIACFSLQGSKAISGGELGIAVTDDPDLYDRMLLLGHYGRIANDAQTQQWDVGGLALGFKYRPHLYGVALALGGLRRLSALNQLRQSNYDLLSDELSECEAIAPVATYPDAMRGGFQEFIFRYRAEAAGNWPIAEFVAALQAEGVPVNRDRYASMTPTRPCLHQANLFCNRDIQKLMGREERSQSPVRLPVTESLTHRSLSLPPMTQVSQRYVKQCAAAICKVVAIARDNPVTPPSASVESAPIEASTAA